ncbi:MAG TPA: hypothetical protein VGM73_09120 [Candidatus Didemnitutus sp.]|jgi:hypothetical protein
MSASTNTGNGKLTLRYSAKIALGCAALCVIAAAIWPDQIGFGCAKNMITGEWESHKSYGALILWGFAVACILVAAIGIERRRK